MADRPRSVRGSNPVVRFGMARLHLSTSEKMLIVCLQIMVTVAAAKGGRRIRRVVSKQAAAQPAPNPAHAADPGALASPR
ncbi:MAG: hypothetical protein LC808_12910, partial [Actinobacteria bacterium]|nr:hypothetical protein [Actinomycetota bacterium]